MTEGEFFVRTEELLLGCEARIALLERLRPLEHARAVARFEESWARGVASDFDFEYARPPGDVDVSRILDESQKWLDSAGEELVARLLTERIEELRVELELVRACGTPRVVELARARYPLDDEELRRADACAAAWLEEQVDVDASEPQVSLVELFRSHPEIIGLGVTVRERDIASTAGVAGRDIVVRRGAQVSRREGERLVVHELEGHLLPRWRAIEQGPPFRVGTKGSSEDEEGRALVLEERAGYFDAARRREIALRYEAAREARRGRDAPDSMRDWLARGVPVADAARLLGRVYRGGGLAREVVYLTSYLRVREALEKEPELERWMKLGRISVAAARSWRAAFG